MDALNIAQAIKKRLLKIFEHVPSSTSRTNTSRNPSSNSKDLRWSYIAKLRLFSQKEEKILEALRQLYNQHEFSENDDNYTIVKHIEEYKRIAGKSLIISEELLELHRQFSSSTGDPVTPDKTLFNRDVEFKKFCDLLEQGISTGTEGREKCLQETRHLMGEAERYREDVAVWETTIQAYQKFWKAHDELGQDNLIESRQYLVEGLDLAHATPQIITSTIKNLQQQLTQKQVEQIYLTLVSGDENLAWEKLTLVTEVESTDFETVSIVLNTIKKFHTALDHQEFSVALELVTNLKNNLESIPSTIIEPFTQWLEQGIHYSGAWLCITRHKFREASLHLAKLEDPDKRDKTKAVLVEQEASWFEDASEKIEQQCKALQISWSLEDLIKLFVNTQLIIRDTSSLTEETCKTFLDPFVNVLRKSVAFFNSFKDSDLSEESKKPIVELGRTLQSLWCDLLIAGVDVDELGFLTHHIGVLSSLFQKKKLIEDFALPENKESALCQSKLV